jgi:hypothetical protein
VSLSQRDLERNVRRKFTRTVVASVTDKSIPLILNGPSIDTGDAVAQLLSPSGALSVTLRSVAGEKKKHFVEVRTKKKKKRQVVGEFCVFMQKKVVIKGRASRWNGKSLLSFDHRQLVAVYDLAMLTFVFCLFCRSGLTDRSSTFWRPPRSMMTFIPTLLLELLSGPRTRPRLSTLLSVKRPKTPSRYADCTALLPPLEVILKRFVQMERSNHEQFLTGGEIEIQLQTRLG